MWKLFNFIELSSARVGRLLQQAHALPVGTIEHSDQKNGIRILFQRLLQLCAGAIQILRGRRERGVVRLCPIQRRTRNGVLETVFSHDRSMLLHPLCNQAGRKGDDQARRNLQTDAREECALRTLRRLQARA